MLTKLLAALLLLLLASGCRENAARQMLETYTSRVGNAIEQEVVTHFDQALAARIPFPPKRQRLIEIPEIREGLIDVLDFRHCDLLHAIAERNTSLGRLAPGSQRLIYELEMLPALRNCRITLTRINDEDLEPLAERLEVIIALKQRTFPSLLWNALYTSEEMEQQFSLGEPPLPLNSETDITPAKQALEHFAELATLSNTDDWETPLFAAELESDFEQLYRTRFGAQWMTSLVLLTHALESTADAIDQRLARRPVCFKQRPNNQARIIRNVFQTFYAGEFQPYLSRVERTGRLWREAQLRIIDQLPATDAARHYFSVTLSEHNPDSLWSHYLLARDRHTQNWQRLLRQCGMMPGQ
ncbi:DUF3080 family protein [Marinobacterium sp. YM272]|uniref:DUF3080 family protein n=1 Tax=Marinobacterium sp. YM272 TaxID=3421654 RepID=UPI003D7F2D2D